MFGGEREAMPVGLPVSRRADGAQIVGKPRHLKGGLITELFHHRIYPKCDIQENSERIVQQF
jgi:hypothetical protein